MRENRIHNLPYEKVGENEPICIADEVPFEIPESWEWARLKDLTIKEIKRGKSPKYADDGNVYVFAQKCNVKLGGIDVSLAKFLDMKTFDKYPVEEYMVDGDIIINSTGNGTLGRIGIFRNSDRINDFVIVPDSHVTTIRTGNRMIKDYLFFALKYHQPYLEKLGEGSTNQTELRPSTVAELFIPVPPSEEQERIVAKLLEVLPMADVYGMKEKSLQDYNKDFPVQLKKSILQEAVQGKLVPQDSNDEPASVLLERIRAEKEALIKAGKIKRDKHESVIFRRDNSHYEKRGSEEICIDDDIPFDCPQSWAWCRMGDLISVRGGKRLPAGAQLTTEKTDHVYIRVTDMKNGTVDLSDLHYISDDIYDSIKNYIIRSEDVYIVIVGSTIGKAGIVPYELDGMNLTENAARLTPILVNRDYLLLAIQTDLLQKQFIDRTNQVGQPKLALERLKTALIPLPPLNEQQRIIETYRTLVPIIQNA